MGKITVFALLGLIIMGSLGWAIGDSAPRSKQQHLQDTRFPTAVVQRGKAVMKADMLEAWMLHGSTPYLLIDTRPASSFAGLHLRRAINRDIDTLLSLQSLRRLPRHKPIVLYGISDRENAAAVEVLRMTGMTAFYLSASNEEWASLPTHGNDPSAVLTARQSSRQKISSRLQETPADDPEAQHLSAIGASQGGIHLGMLDD